MYHRTIFNYIATQVLSLLLLLLLTFEIGALSIEKNYQQLIVDRKLPRFPKTYFNDIKNYGNMISLL